ncbi:hypothetical protein Patl1_04658 [Pistacia atlantica]|uniref:Uncharacterized protein n=1 Tax=Pistacia atlantica TaxID=434234 RepID=A0ACC1BR47_9ROSI|nr:hypothetical protein Patl1_04658 [Pistacia atlantica]
MANPAARMLLKNGRSFPQLLRSRLVGQSSVDICIKEQQLFQSLINPKQKIFGQKPVLGDGFNFVDFVMGKDQALCTEKIKMPTVAARGMPVVIDVDDDDDVVDDDDDDVYDDDDIGDFVDDDDDEDDDDDDDEDDDDYDDGVRTR